MSVADGRTGAMWRAEGRGQAEVRPDCPPGGQQACQEGHSSLDLGLAASWNRFGYPGWRQISGIRLHLRPIGDCCSSGEISGLGSPRHTYPTYHRSHNAGFSTEPTSPGIHRSVPFRSKHSRCRDRESSGRDSWLRNCRCLQLVRSVYSLYTSPIFSILTKKSPVQLGCQEQ